jgi:tetratricopeptide (TPR) repeat protein
MNLARLLVYLLWSSLLVHAVNAQEVPAQTSAPRRLLEALPRDKTPEQTLALLALNFGVEEFKTHSIERAIRYFVEAKRLDPDLINARLYLATAYASQYIPGDISEANLRRRDAAAQEFRDSLNVAPGNLSALDGLGSILFQSANAPLDPVKYQESRLLFKKHIELAPKDPEPYYWVGVIDWTTSFKANKDLRAQLRDADKEKPLADTDPLPAELRKTYTSKSGPAVEEGIESMKQAIALRPEFEDAMAYLNLLYRRKADMVENTEERSTLLKMADDLIDKVRVIKQKRAEQASQP